MYISIAYSVEYPSEPRVLQLRLNSSSVRCTHANTSIVHILPAQHTLAHTLPISIILRCSGCLPNRSRASNTALRSVGCGMILGTERLGELSLSVTRYLIATLTSKSISNLKMSFRLLAGRRLACGLRSAAALLHCFHFSLGNLKTAFHVGFEPTPTHAEFIN